MKYNFSNTNTLKRKKSSVAIAIAIFLAHNAIFRCPLPAYWRFYKSIFLWITVVTGRRGCSLIWATKKLWPYIFKVLYTELIYSPDASINMNIMKVCFSLALLLFELNVVCFYELLLFLEMSTWFLQHDTTTWAQVRTR